MKRVEGMGFEPKRAGHVFISRVVSGECIDSFVIQGCYLVYSYGCYITEKRYSLIIPDIQ